MYYQYPDTVIQVFCKAPIAGQVKTRLISSTITAEQAMLLHIELTEKVLKLLHQAALCRIQLWCSPTTECEFFHQQVKKYAVTLHQQTEGGLGKRMFYAMNTALQDFHYALLIGCDCPSLTIDDFKQAITALKHGADVVFAPTEDGGYSLIGTKQAQAEVLNDTQMPWGTAQVLAITRERVKRQQLNAYELRLQWDIDRPEDLLRYRMLQADSFVSVKNIFQALKQIAF